MGERGDDGVELLPAWGEVVALADDRSAAHRVTGGIVRAIAPSPRGGAGLSPGGGA